MPRPSAASITKLAMNRKRNVKKKRNVAGAVKSLKAKAANKRKTRASLATASAIRAKALKQKRTKSAIAKAKKAVRTPAVQAKLKKLRALMKQSKGKVGSTMPKKGNFKLK